tara:strand:- start:394 stop:708 length:315 start_codon:yes stop_codon:yes gene_type:complete
MTFFYKTYSLSQGGQRIPEETRKLWELLTDKKNWRIVQLPNGYYQAEYCSVSCEEGENCEDCKWHDVTRRETIDACETAIDKSIEHYQKKLEFINGPKVVKTFK